VTRRGVVIVGALAAMVAATIAGWQLAGVPPAGPTSSAPRTRLAILPFDDPSSTVDDPFNRALAEAFAVALANAAPESFVVVGPTTTARMMAAGLTTPQIAARADADLLLSGGHTETDHSTSVRLIMPDGEELLARDFAVDEAAPAAAPASVVEAIAAAIERLRGPGG
jgi:TolB-like protein